MAKREIISRELRTEIATGKSEWWFANHAEPIYVDPGQN